MSIQSAVNAMLGDIENKALWSALYKGQQQMTAKIPSADDIKSALAPTNQAIQGLQSTAEVPALNEATTDYSAGPLVEGQDFVDMSQSQAEQEAEKKFYQMFMNAAEGALKTKAQMQVELKQKQARQNRINMARRVEEAKAKQSENRRKGYERRYK